MVRWPGVMWNRLILTLLLASTASSSGSACPENCQCSGIAPREPRINLNGTESREIRCKGRIPRLASLLDESIGRLVVEVSEPRTIRDMLLDLESRPRNNNNTRDDSLQELAIVNCSLTYLNLTFTRGPKGLSVSSLNLTNNEFTEIGALRIAGDASDRLMRLDLSDNRLFRVRIGAFAKFSRLVQLTLRRNEIRVVERDGFAGLGSLESLDLSENRLATLAQDTFVPLYFLQKLDLSGNELSALDGQWFGSLGRLRELDVSRNRLARRGGSTITTEKIVASVPAEDPKGSGTLEALPFGLTVLRLADNPLMELELSLVLGSGRRLETVDASRIGLDRVPPALTRSVRDLTLAGNKLTTIRSGDLDSYPLLRLLDLSNNSLGVVEEDALGRLEVLERLDLSRNKLTELPQSLPSSLVHLVIRYNSIVRLTVKDLQGLGKLEKLCLDNNAITEIEEGSISQLALLTELDVSDNPLKQLPANTFGGPRSLVYLRLSGLTSLEWEREKRADMAFPVPAPERIVSLDLSRSPALAAQLLADEAALSACKSLRRLNLAQNNLTTLRSDLAYLLPQLHTLGLAGNEWNCTSANSDVYWLADWIKQHEEIEPPAKCAKSSNFLNVPADIMLAELPNYRTSVPTTVWTTPTSSSSLDSRESHIANEDSERSKGKLDESTTANNVRLRSVPNFSNSYTIGTDSITTSTSSVGTGNPVGNTDIEGSTEPILRSVFIDQSGVDYDDVLPELPTIRTAESIVVFEETKGNVLNIVDDDDTPTGKIDSIGAQELTGSEETSKSEFTIQAHPGMLVVLIGAALGIIATLSVVLSRRLTPAFADQRIVLSSQEQQPIVAELW